MIFVYLCVDTPTVASTCRCRVTCVPVDNCLQRVGHHHGFGLRGNVIRQRGGGGREDDEDVLSRQRSRGDASTAAGRRILSKRLRRAAAGGSVKEVEAVLADGSDPHGVDLAGFTALHLTAEQGHIGVAQLLVAKGAEPDARDSMAGRTPLHVAAVRGNPVMIDLLVRAGADIEAQDDSGRTPLAVAAWEGKKSSVDALLNHSATVSTRDRYGQDPVGLIQLTPLVQDDQVRMEVADMLQNGLVSQREALGASGALDVDVGTGAGSQLDVLD